MGVPITPAMPTKRSVRPKELVRASRPSKSTSTTDVSDTYTPVNTTTTSIQPNLGNNAQLFRDVTGGANPESACDKKNLHVLRANKRLAQPVICHDTNTILTTQGPSQLDLLG